MRNGLGRHKLPEAVTHSRTHALTHSPLHRTRSIELPKLYRMPPSRPMLIAAPPFWLYRKKFFCAGEATAWPKTENPGMRTCRPPVNVGEKLVFFDCTL